MILTGKEPERKKEEKLIIEFDEKMNRMKKYLRNSRKKWK